MKILMKPAGIAIVATLVLTACNVPGEGVVEEGSTDDMNAQGAETVADPTVDESLEEMPPLRTETDGEFPAPVEGETPDGEVLTKPVDENRTGEKETNGN